MEEQVQQRNEQLNQQTQQLAQWEQQQPQAPIITVHTDSGLWLTGVDEANEDSEIPPEYTEL